MKTHRLSGADTSSVTLVYIIRRGGTHHRFCALRRRSVPLRRRYTIVYLIFYELYCVRCVAGSMAAARA